MQELPIDERVVVIEARNFKHLDYVFFRRFTDGRSSQVAAYVVDNTGEQHDKQALAELHREVWLQGKAPLLYIAWPGRIDILSCARGEDFWDKRNERCRYHPAKELLTDTIDTAAEIAQAFSLHRLADGTFWEDASHQALINHHKMAHSMLIQAVVETDKQFSDEERSLLRRLLLLHVLIKYLEDRNVFPENWFNDFHPGAKLFLDVLRSGDPEKVARLLRALEEKFNGDVFVFPHNELNGVDLRHFADFVEARTLKQQRFLWAQYSFAHLPVEIISHLYQRFVQGGHGTVYTPPFLATLLLDRAMPYGQLTGKERILDPSCGSGVFLVGAFRRLIHVWRYQHAWQRPDVETLKDILRRSIFGIEWENFAVDLTAFSLSLALCDALQSKVIWHELRFDRLRDVNLLRADFFRVLRDEWQGKETILSNGFDIVIGNPPFESQLSEHAKAVNQEAQRLTPNRGKLPDKQIAYLFLEQAFTILKLEGSVCLIQSSGFLYNKNTANFRTSLFCKHQVDAIFDFVSIRKLYGADPKTVAILARNVIPANDNLIQHWTFRRTASVHERLCFEIDYYDQHIVPQIIAESNEFVWRINLLGGGRLHGLSQRMRSFPSLKQFIAFQKKNYGWEYGEGFNVGTNGKPAPQLSGKLYLPAEALTSKGINSELITTLRKETFVYAGTQKKFTPPLILLREVDSLPMDFWEYGFLPYPHRIVGIHAPASQTEKLRTMYHRLQSHHSTYRLLLTIHGTEALVGQATSIRKQDIDHLPYPDDDDNLALTPWEEALRDDALDYMIDYVRLGQESKLLTTTADSEAMRVYADQFVGMLGSIYGNLHTNEPVFLGGLICQSFYFGEYPQLPWTVEGREEAMRALIYQDEQHRRLRTVRMLRFYTENALLLVKPNRLRYWIRSTAIRDADDTLADLYRWGY